MFDDSTDGRPETPPDAPDGSAEYQPPPNVMRNALRRIRMRRNDVRTMNELFEAVSSLVRGFATLLGSEKFRNGGRHE